MDHRDADSFEDLISDESFQNWVLGSATEDECRFWESWIRNHPESRENVDKAYIFLSAFSGTESTIPTSRVEDAWLALAQSIPHEQDQKSFRIKNQPHLLGYASAFLFLIVCGIGLFLFSKTEEQLAWATYSTNYGEKSEVTLDDGTQITLNSHSVINVAMGQKIRKVRMTKGEAFFKVKKLSTPVPFIVYLDKVQVEVLGTEFNINLRQSATKVMLREGKVRLVGATGETTTLSPGELASLDSHGAFTIVPADVPSTEAWLHGKVVFKDTKLSDVAVFIEDHYNKFVKMDPHLRNQKLTGELPNNNLELLLKALRISHDLTITHNTDTIVISE